MSQPPSQPARLYHERTKHQLNRLAKGPEYLDWDDQPDPFRRFAGAESLPLPLAGKELERPWQALLDGQIPPAPVDLKRLASLFEYSLGLAVWKRYGPNRWALRCNPSSGNLHPTEGYLVCLGLADLADGVYHYGPEQHRLERRCCFPNSDLETPEVWVGLSSIFWREAWKYGERAFRYVQLDIGHALGAIRYAAALLGWQLQPAAIDDPGLATLLGLDREEEFEGAELEHPDLLMQITPAPTTPLPALIELARQGEWTGKANPLGGEPHFKWPVIGQVAQMTRIQGEWPQRPVAQPPSHPPLAIDCPKPATRLIKERRSAQAMDPQQGMTKEQLLALLDSLLPRPQRPPWDSWPQQPRIHPLLMVHRVEGLAPGLYLLPRHTAAQTELPARMKEEYHAAPVASDIPHFPLLQLFQGDAQQVARTLGCHQKIASHGCFAVAMLAEFDSALAAHPAEYRRLHWEAGLIGQQLYLGSEALGLQGTGIGCFFDDAVLDLLGLTDSGYQSLYHFTVGKALPDSRIESDPPYPARGA
jgi:SagB-type dehydrogenase family enzyme